MFQFNYPPRAGDERPRQQQQNVEGLSSANAHELRESEEFFLGKTGPCFTERQSRIGPQINLKQVHILGALWGLQQHRYHHRHQKNQNQNENQNPNKKQNQNQNQNQNRHHCCRPLRRLRHLRHVTFFVILAIFDIFATLFVIFVIFISVIFSSCIIFIILVFSWSLASPSSSPSSTFRSHESAVRMFQHVIRHKEVTSDNNHHDDRQASGPTIRISVSH